MKKMLLYVITMIVVLGYASSVYAGANVPKQTPPTMICDLQNKLIANEAKIVYYTANYPPSNPYLQQFIATKAKILSSIDYLETLDQTKKYNCIRDGVNLLVDACPESGHCP